MTQASLRVLVVDDNADVRDSLVLVLQLLGHSAYSAAEGEAALELMVRERPQLVLLDLTMPGLSGHDVARRAAALPTRATMKLVAVSGWSRAEDRRLAMQSGFDEYVVKPLDLPALRSLLAQLQS